jgi:hypothetical protein
MGKVRVLALLVDAKGPLTRVKIASRLGSSGTYVGKSVGYSDPAKRASFEQTKDGGGTPGNPCPSLLTLDYVREYELEVPEDGISETVVEITPAGRKAFKALGKLDLPPLS